MNGIKVYNVVFYRSFVTWFNFWMYIIFQLVSSLLF